MSSDARHNCTMEVQVKNKKALPVARFREVNNTEIAGIRKQLLAAQDVVAAHCQGKCLPVALRPRKERPVVSNGKALAPAAVAHQQQAYQEAAFHRSSFLSALIVCFAACPLHEMMVPGAPFGSYNLFPALPVCPAQ